MLLPPTLQIFLLTFTIALAHDNGMDMSMDNGMVMAQGTMIPYLHFSRGDSLWFQGWVPQSKGALAGAAIGLFMLALLERWVAACRAGMEGHWAKTANQLVLARGAKRTMLQRQEEVDADRKKEQAPSKRGFRFARISPPFILAHDVPRGVLYAIQMGLGYALMLAIMTFQAAFFIAIVIGLGVGEMLFGRFVSRGGGVH